MRFNLFFNKKIKLLKDILNDSKELITNRDYENALSLIDNNECSLALELICEQLFEYDKKVSLNLYNKIKDVGEYYKVDGSILELVKNQVNQE